MVVQGRRFQFSCPYCWLKDTSSSIFVPEPKYLKALSRLKPVRLKTTGSRNYLKTELIEQILATTRGHPIFLGQIYCLRIAFKWYNSTISLVNWLAFSVGRPGLDNNGLSSDKILSSAEANQDTVITSDFLNKFFN